MIRKSPLGYTIIEVMIFLAITGMLFTSALVAVGGSQRQAQYSQAVRDFETQVKDVANDITNGYYPAYERGRCSVVGNGSNISWDNSVLGTPGTSDRCINIGKNLMFKLGDPDSFGVGTVVGIGPGIGQQPDLTLATLKPTLAYQNPGLNSINLTTFKPIRFGATVTKIGLVDDTTKSYRSLVFLNDFNTSSQVQENGRLSINVYGIEGPIGNNKSIGNYLSEVESLQNPTTPIEVNPRNGFYICLKTSDNRYARVIIGIDGAVTATKSEFDLIGGVECPV